MFLMNEYTLLLQSQVTDHGNEPKTAITSVTITVYDINDNTPAFSKTSYSFRVAENSGSGASVGTVTATDVDKDLNADLEFSFVSFSLGKMPHFKIDQDSGEITIAGPLDRESIDSYRATVKVRKRP